MTKTFEKDYLSQKTNKLARLQSASANAVNIVTLTVSNLEMTNDEIDRTIAEIEDYKAGLEDKQNGLCEMKEKNLRIVQNFKKLIED